MTFDFKTWVTQPTTITGIGLFIGSAAAALTQYLAHDVTATVAVFGVVHGAINVLMKDNTAEQKKPIEDLFMDMAQAVMQRNVAQMAPKLAADAMNAFQVFQMPGLTGPVTVAQPVAAPAPVAYAPAPVAAPAPAPAPYVPVQQAPLAPVAAPQP